MNKQTLKGLLAGVIAGAVTVYSFPVIANSVEALMNSVNIELNGEKVASVNESYMLQNGTMVPYSILYEGTTYLPIRKVSELLEIDIDWDNDTRSVLIDSNKLAGNYDSWYGAPDFGAMNGIKEFKQSPTTRSTTHWYDVKAVTDAHIDSYIKQLEDLGYERVEEGTVRPRFKVYKKGNIEVWMDLGMYTQLLYGVTVMDSTRPFCSGEYSYAGSREDIPTFSSAFRYSATEKNGRYYSVGNWNMWACLPDYFALLEAEGFRVSSIETGFYGKGYTLKKDRSTVNVEFDGSEYSTLPAVVVKY